MMTHVRRIILVAALAVLSGCVSSTMRRLGPGATAPAPQAADAVIIFMRPSKLGYAIQSSVFDVRPDGDRFVGIVSSTTKVAYPTQPGQHLFMVIGENADFMRAEVAAGKTYYALVTPRMGWWKARFSLRPVHKDELDSADFKDWRSSTELIENTDASRQWAKDNWDSIEDKKVDYMRKWEQKSDADKNEVTLRAEDGR